MERDEPLQDVMEYEKRKLSLRSVIQAIMGRHGYESYSFLFNDGINIEQLEEDQPKMLSLSESQIRNLEHTVKFGTDSEIRNTPESLKLNALRDNKTIANYRPFMISLMHIMVSYAESIGVDLAEVMEGDVLDIVIKFRSLEQVFDWALGGFFKLRELNLATKMTSSQKLLDRAVLYIDNNYMDSTISSASLLQRPDYPLWNPVYLLCLRSSRSSAYRWT